jgi:transcription termination/antitermination protein NusA
MYMPDEQPRDLFVRVLAINQAVADLLIANDIRTLEEVAYVPEDELTAIDGLDQKLIPIMRQRARAHLLRGGMSKE